MKIADLFIKRSVTTLTLTGAIIIFGLFGFRSMGVDLFPEIDLPVVSVYTILPGASPDVVDENVTAVIEEQISTISGIETLTSQSFEGASQIIVQFDLNKDVNVAATEVQDKVNLARQQLPNDVEDPIISKVDLNAQPIVWVSVSGSVDYNFLADYADRVVKEQLQSVSGVGDVQLGGLRERTVRIWVDPEKVESYDLTTTDIVRAIQSNHIELPGGRIEQADEEFTIKVKGEFESVEALQNLVLKESNGGVVYLSDVAEVQDGSADYRNIAHFNGIPTIGLGVAKQSGTNTVEVAQAIKERVEEIKQITPEGVEIQVASDNSVFIENSMVGVQFDLFFGILMTALIMYIFLRNIRATFISVVSIPVSLLGGLIIMYFLDFTVNNLTMLGLSLAVGLVIDDTIVVLENVFRHVEEGKDPVTASSEGTKEVGLAVVAAGSTIIAVFLPVAFMQGIIGRFFFQFGLTVALTVIVSVLVSITLTPYLTSRLLKKEQDQNSRFYKMMERFFVRMEWGYRSVLQWATVRRGRVMFFAFLAFAGGIAIAPFLGAEFATEADQSKFMIRYELPTGTSIDRTNRRLYAMEDLVFSYPEVQSVFSTAGTGASGSVNQGVLIVTLVSQKERNASQFDVMDRAREEFTERFPDMITTVSVMSGVGGGGRTADVQYYILGPTTEEVGEVSNRVVQRLQDMDEFISVDTDLRLTKPEINVNINRDLATDLGVNVQSLSSEIFMLFGGQDIAKFSEGGNRYDIRIRAKPEFRSNPEDISRIAVRNQQGELIRTANLVDIEIGEGPNSINRYNRMRAVQIYADMADGVSPGEGLEIVAQVVNEELPESGIWRTDLGGQTRTMQESFGYLLTALIIAILVIYMVLAIQFESFLHPFTIMMALPLTMIGVFGALFITGATLNIFSFIGIIMLMGLVTKNSILLVDFANQLREKGTDKVLAIIQAGQMRLRPILMTAVSTITGVLPVALALSEGGETRAPMAIAIIGGMLTSTLLTLVVIPVIYLIFDDTMAWIKTKLSSFTKKNTFATHTN